MDAWQRYAFKPGDERRFADHGAGILLGHIVGADIDVSDPDAAIAIENAARQIFGIGETAEVPRRIGREPRVLLPLRTLTPFRKIATAFFKLPSDDLEKHSRVEVLAEGQQFVAYAVHPFTRRPYEWNGGGDLLSVHADALPLISEDQARAFISEAESILEEWGERVGVKSEGALGTSSLPDDVKRDLRSALNALDPDDRDSWVRQANRLCEFGQDGLTLWLEFSQRSEKYEPRDAMRVWRSAKHDQTGHRAIFSEAQARGWRNPGAKDEKNVSNEAPLWTLPDPISDNEFEAANLAPPCIVENYLFADVAVLVAPGGTGKTTLTLYEAIHIVLARSLFGLRIHKPGPVLILTAEDSREMLVARARALAGAMNLSADERAKLQRDLRISDVSGEALKLTLIVGDVVMPAPMVDDIIEQARPLAPVLVNIDPAVSFGVGEARVNDAEQGLIEAARRIRRELGCCVRYVHHSGKQNARDAAIDQYAGRGGSALPDGARMVAVLQPMKPDAWASQTGASLLDGETGMVLARPKLSYAPPQPDILISRRGYTFTHTSRFEVSKAETLAAHCDQIVRFLESELAEDRRHTQNSLAAQAGILNMSRDAVRDAVHTLLARNRVEQVLLPGVQRGPRTYLRPVAARPPQ